jgi:hypothetical protein
MRIFTTGATRDNDDGKFDYEGFLSPLALEAYANYMHVHRKQSDGQLRASDNWQKGIPKEAYMKSAFRHFMEWWKQHRYPTSQDLLVDALCAIIFNAQGYLHTILRENQGNVEGGQTSDLPSA